MSYDWLTLWKASRAQKKLHELHGPNGGGSGCPATGARYGEKIATGIQGGKLSTAKKIQFLQTPVASFFCELFSVFRQSKVFKYAKWPSKWLTNESLVSDLMKYNFFFV